MNKSLHLKKHPIDSGVSPWSSSNLIKSEQWVYNRAGLFSADFAIDPAGVIFCRYNGWCKDEDIINIRNTILSFDKLMQSPENIYLLHFDFLHLEGMDLSARRIFINFMYSDLNIRGIAFCSPNLLIKSFIQLGRIFRHADYRASICDNWQSGCNKISKWMKEIQPGCDWPEISSDVNDKNNVQTSSEMDTIMNIISKIEWVTPGPVHISKDIDISQTWKSFFDVIGLLKQDLDSLVAYRKLRLTELKENTEREKKLQEEMGHALIESAHIRDIVNRELIRNETLSREIIDTQKETLFALGEIIESRSKETANHIRRVAEYSMLLARYIDLPEHEQQYILHASPMHDAGKIAIPDAILNKPGKLTDEEFEIMKTHTTKGYDMLKGSQYEIMILAATIALQHHEKWNGKGYPKGLSGESIHIFGRIVALADVFDALGSDRCYKKAWPIGKVLDLIHNERGEHFDPMLVEVFFENLNEFLIIREKFPDVIS